MNDKDLPPVPIELLNSYLQKRWGHAQESIQDIVDASFILGAVVYDGLLGMAYAIQAMERRRRREEDDARYERAMRKLYGFAQEGKEDEE